MTTPSNAALAKAAELAQRIIDNPGWGATWADNVVRPIAEAYLALHPDAPDVRTAGSLRDALGELELLTTIHVGDQKKCAFCGAEAYDKDPLGHGPKCQFAVLKERPAPASAAPIKTDHELEFAVASIWVALDRPTTSDGVPDDTIARPLAVAIVDRVRNPFSASAAPNKDGWLDTCCPICEARMFVGMLKCPLYENCPFPVASAAPSEPMSTDMFGRTSWEADEDNIWEDPNMGDQ